MDEEVGGSGSEDVKECVKLRDESVGEDEGGGRRFIPSFTRAKGSCSGLNDGFTRFDLAEFNESTENSETEAGFISNGALDVDANGASSIQVKTRSTTSRPLGVS